MNIRNAGCFSVKNVSKKSNLFTYNGTVCVGKPAAATDEKHDQEGGEEGYGPSGHRMGTAQSQQPFTIAGENWCPNTFSPTQKNRHGEFPGISNDQAFA